MNLLVLLESRDGERSWFIHYDREEGFRDVYWHAREVMPNYHTMVQIVCDAQVSDHSQVVENPMREKPVVRGSLSSVMLTPRRE